MSGLRDRAAGVVGALAERLRDPATVAQRAVAHGTTVDVAGTGSPVWVPRSMAGYPALALLYAELGHADQAWRQVAHRYLSLVARESGSDAYDGPFEGLGALATAVRAASHGPGEYGSILARLDRHAAGYARRLVAIQQSCRSAGRPTTPSVVDAVYGLAGAGRYLLHRRHTEVLAELLTSLTSLDQPLEWAGARVPGWWYDATATTNLSPGYENGQANFGLSHGLPGPLGLLSLAWRAGFRVPGQDEAIAQMAEWLLEWREYDDAGAYWPAHIPLSYYLDRSGAAPPPARASWCYGAVGTARALVLAGRALDRPEWTAAALAAVAAMMARPVDSWGVTDQALCHGWSGLMYQLDQLDREHPDPRFSKGAAYAAEQVLDAFEEAAPFGFRYYQPFAGKHLDLPGLLDGAAGIALALSAYAADAAPASCWDSVLLLR